METRCGKSKELGGRIEKTNRSREKEKTDFGLFYENGTDYSLFMKLIYGSKTDHSIFINKKPVKSCRDTPPGVSEAI